MSILTKICIVLLVVLILPAVPVFVTQATIAPNYRKAYEEEEKRARLYAQDARRHMIMLRSSEEARAQERERANESKATMSTRITQLQHDKHALENSNSDLRRTIESQEVKRGVLQSQLTNAQNARAELKREIDDAQKGYKKKITDLTDTLYATKKQLDEAVAERERALKIARLRHEQMVRVEEEKKRLEEIIVELRRRGKTAGDVMKEPEGPVQNILGSVTAVGQNIASINVGRTKGVRKGMVFLVHRLDQYVCRLQIESVHLDKAAGIIVDKKLEPQVDDKVVAAAK